MMLREEEEEEKGTMIFLSVRLNEY